MKKVNEKGFTYKYFLTQTSWRANIFHRLNKIVKHGELKLNIDLIYRR